MFGHGVFADLGCMGAKDGSLEWLWGEGKCTTVTAHVTDVIQLHVNLSEII